MGVRLDIVAFDSVVFYRTIIPAFREGENNALIKKELAILASFGDSSPSFTNASKGGFNGLKKVMETFNHTMTLSLLGNKFFVNEKGEICSERQNTGWRSDDFFELLVFLTLKYCARYVTSFYRIYDMEDVLTIKNADHSHVSAQYYVSKLDRSAQLYFQATGLKGWLDELEIKEFYREIKEGNVLFPANPRNEFPHFRTMSQIIEIAVQQNLGLLVGRDLSYGIVEGQTDERNNVVKLEYLDFLLGDGCVNFKGMYLERR